MHHLKTIREQSKKINNLEGKWKKLKDILLEELSNSTEDRTEYKNGYINGIERCICEMEDIENE